MLGHTAYGTYLGPLSHKGGANKTTHLAEIRYPVQAAPIASVVKLMPPDGLAACNEALAWLFLRAGGFSAPTNAAILVLPEAKIVEILGRKLVPKQWVHQGKVVAWAARQLDFKSIQAVFAGTNADAKWLEVLRTVEGAAIAAFDEAFLNIDRNTGNMLFVSNSNCVPIDHELCFATQNWLAGELHHLDMDGDSLRVLRAAVLGGKVPANELHTAYNRMVFHAQKHAEALQACEAHMQTLLETLYPSQASELAPRVLSFVTERTALRWMEERLGVV